MSESAERCGIDRVRADDVDRVPVGDAEVAIEVGDAGFTQDLLVDEEVLREAGVTDFDRYLCVPHGHPVYIVGANAVDPAALG